MPILWTTLLCLGNPQNGNERTFASCKIPDTSLLMRRSRLVLECDEQTSWADHLTETEEASMHCKSANVDLKASFDRLVQPLPATVV